MSNIKVRFKTQKIVVKAKLYSSYNRNFVWGDINGEVTDQEDLVEYISDLLSGKANTVHNHDDRYYTETETNNLLNGKQNSLGFTPENVANKNIPNGYVGLSSLGKISESVLPTNFGKITTIPVAPAQRGADTSLGANQAYGQPAGVPSRIKVRRARVRVGTQAGLMTVALYDKNFNRVFTSGEVQAGQNGAMEIALPPTTINPDYYSLWVSASSGLLTLGVASTHGDLIDGYKQLSSHPLPASIIPAPTTLLPSIALLADDPTPLASTYTYTRTDININVIGQSGTRLYGVSLLNGHWVTSDNDGVTWDDRVTSPSAQISASPIQIIFHSTFMYAITLLGTVWRQTKDVFNTAWTNVSVPSLPAGTTGRVDICTSNGTFLYYGNYNNVLPGVGNIYRSADNGDTWSLVLNQTDARHIHAIYVDPTNSTRIFATLGDASQAGKGLYVSNSSGASGTWTRISSNAYGINLLLAPLITGVPRKILLEGDGLDTPHIYQFQYGLIGTSGLTDPLIWHDVSPESGLNWRGTARSIFLTTDNNLFYISTSENGAVGTRDGIWVARGPWYSTPVLLEELTGNVPISYGKTYQAGSNLFNYRYRISLPKFAGQ